jgi:protein-tyrosine-phosphatase
MLVEDRVTFPRSYRVGMHCRHLSSDFYWLFANARANKKDPTLATRGLMEILREPLLMLSGYERWDTFACDDPLPGCVDVASFVTQLMRKSGRFIRRRVSGARWARRRMARRLLAKARSAHSLLFVCKGNICRSPFAELYARPRAPAGIKIFSSGSFPTANRPSPEPAVVVAGEHGIDLTHHRSRVLDEEQASKADIILTFDRQNFEEVRLAYPHLRERVFPLGVLAGGGESDIADPFGGDVEGFRRVYASIAEAITALCKALPSRT